MSPSTSLITALLLFNQLVFAGQPLPSCRLEVRVSDTSGEALEGVSLELTQGGVAVVQLSETEPGVFQSPLFTGVYELTISREGFMQTHQTLTLKDGEKRKVQVKLPINDVFERVTVTEESEDATATKLPMTLHETPRAITVVDETDIREHNYRSVNDTFAYTPGMSVNSQRTGGYHFYARGYRMGPDDTRIDGSAGVNAGGRYSSSLFGIEKVVILRGPAGLLYGSSNNPGGLVNMITKKPVREGFTRVDLRTAGYAGNGVGLGDRSTAGIELDSTGSLSSNGKVLYRALGQFENADYFSAGVSDQNRALNTTLTFQLDDAERFSLSPQVQWTRFNRDNGGGILISPSTSLTTSDGSEGPINRNDLSSLDVALGDGGGIDETLQTGLSFNGAVTPALHLNATYRMIQYDTNIDQYAPAVTTAVQRALLRDEFLVTRQHTKSNTERRYHNLDLNGTYEWTGSAAWKNLFQVGMFTRRTSTRGTSPDGTVPGAHSPINIYTGETSSALGDVYPDLIWRDWADTSYWNGYVQNQTSLWENRLVVTAGLGYGQNHTGGSTTIASKLMPNGSIVYNPSPQLAVYASYATSYNPTDATYENSAGQAGGFDPEQGKNQELGVKFDSKSRRSSITFSVFQNQLGNDLVQSAPGEFNPNGNLYYVAVGSRESEGAELVLDSGIGDLSFSTTLSYLDATYTGEGPAGANLPLPGTRAEKSPEWSTSFWSRYAFAKGRLGGFATSLGWIWNDERLGSNRGRTVNEPDPLVLPSFSRWDLGFSYLLKSDLELDLQIQNLFDELIFVNGSVGSSLEVAAPRNLNLRIGYRF